MVNTYEQFTEHFGKYSEYAGNYKSATEGRLSPNLKEAAADLMVDEHYKNYMRNTRDARPLMIVFNKASEISKRKIDGVLSGGLENMLEDGEKTNEGKEDIRIGVQMVEPRDNYTGSKSAVYSEIAGLHREVKSVGETLQNEDYDTMKTKLKELYRTQYSADNEKEQLEILDILVEHDNEFNKYRFSALFGEKREQFTTKLEGNEPGYLAANLEGKDFIEFYSQLLQMKEEMAKQSQRQSEGQSQRQSPRGRRSR